MRKIIAYSVQLLLTGSVVAGCAQMGGSGASKPDTAAAGAHRIGPGMDASGAVIDPTKVEAGYGQSVTGVGDWQGEITGIPAPNSPFSRLQIGMGMRQVMDICGPPSDQGAYITGKAFIPFYFGSDRYRYETVYRGEGRLIFAGGATGDMSGAHLIWIIHSAADSGYR